MFPRHRRRGAGKPTRRPFFHHANLISAGSRHKIARHHGRSPPVEPHIALRRLIGHLHHLGIPLTFPGRAFRKIAAVRRVIHKHLVPAPDIVGLRPELASIPLIKTFAVHHRCGIMIHITRRVSVDKGTAPPLIEHPARGVGLRACRPGLHPCAGIQRRKQFRMRPAHKGRLLIAQKRIGGKSRRMVTLYRIPL